MRQPMVVREPGICSLITQTAPIIFTAPRYPLLIDSEFRSALMVCSVDCPNRTQEEGLHARRAGAPIFWSGDTFV